MSVTVCRACGAPVHAGTFCWFQVATLKFAFFDPPTSWVVRQFSGFYKECLRGFFRGFIAEQMKPVS